MSEEAVSVFLSYSRSDLEMLNKLNKQLASLVRTQKIKTWHDRDIEAGSEWEPEIQHRLNTADIIILLISADFMASEYCYGNELKRAIERHEAGEARVIPVILKPCLWNLREIPFSKLNVLPDHARPITRWEDPEEAYAAVALHISDLVEKLRQRKIEQEINQRQQELEKQRQAEEQEQRLAQQAAEQQAEQERIERERQHAEEQARLRQAERLRQQQAEAERLKQQEHERQQQAERQRLLLEQQQAKEQERLRQAELLRQKATEAEAEAARLKQQDLRGNYARLEALLKAGKWKEADQETGKQMCAVMGRQKEGWLQIKDIQQFPCADLREIDRLWVKYSKGKFGFSVQKQIWQECGSPTGYNKDWEKFGDRVGWRTKGFLGLNKDWISYSDVTFDTAAPQRHLPRGGGRVVGGAVGGGSLLSRNDL